MAVFQIRHLLPNNRGNDEWLFSKYDTFSPPSPPFSPSLSTGHYLFLPFRRQAVVDGLDNLLD